MEFYLVKEKHVVFKDPPTKFENAVFAERETSLEASLQPTEKYQDEQSQRDFTLIKNLVETNEFEETDSTENAPVQGPKCLPSGIQRSSNNHEKLNGALLISVGMHNAFDKRHFIGISDAAEGNLVTKLNDITKTHGIRFKITIKCTNYLCKKSDGTVLDPGIAYKSWSAFGDLEQVSSRVEGNEGIELQFSNYLLRGYWDQVTAYKEHSIVLSIVCNAFPKSTVSIFTSVSTLAAKSMYQKILEDEVKPDAAIRTKDNSEVKCHRSILSVQSDVLEKNFKGSFSESQTNVVEMLDMTTESVKAFLAYLYYFDMEKIMASSTIAVEGFQASHKYNISSLEEKIQRILLTKPDNWFNVEAALDLFLFARNLENGDGLKMRAVKLIKMNHASFKTSPKYKELMKENPEAAMDFVEILCMQ